MKMVPKIDDNKSNVKYVKNSSKSQRELGTPVNPPDPKAPKRNPSLSSSSRPPSATPGRPPRDMYVCKVCYAFFLGLALILYGAFLVIVLQYSILSQDKHAIVCVVGFSFLCGLAILSFNVFHGWSYVLRFHHRKLLHACLNLLGLVIGISGTVIMLTSKKPESAHGILGIITMCFSIIAGLLGHCAIQAWGEPNPSDFRKRIIHITLGIFTFILAATTIILGFLVNGKFKEHLSANAQIAGIVLVSCFTLAIVINACISFKSRNTIIR